MISYQLMLSTVVDLKHITRKDFAVLDCDGKLVATTLEDTTDIPYMYVDAVVNSPAEHQLIQGKQYFKVIENHIPEYIVLVDGEDEDTFRVGKLAAFHLHALMVAYKERFDKDGFIKSLLLDNVLTVDILNGAKRLQLEMNARRAVFLISIPLDTEQSALEILRNLFPDKDKDFIAPVDETCVVLVKELEDKDGECEINSIAKNVADTLSSEAMYRVNVAIGSVNKDLRTLSAAYKEARLAHEVGRIFEAGKQIVNYERLGIGRLIYQLPVPLCHIFIKEMLRGFTIDEIDEEMFNTVTKFFENDLNVSETARELYIHRNTLVYRLDKLEKMTKLDLRKFSDAIIFKISLMVNRYMQYTERHV